MTKKKNLSVKSTVRELEEDPAGAAVLGKFLPEGAWAGIKAQEDLKKKSLEKLSFLRPDLLPAGKLPMIAAALSFLGERSGTDFAALGEYFKREAPAGTLPVIVCPGDSITFGAGAEEGRDLRSWPAILSRKLAGKFEAINYGMNGATLQKNGDLPYLDEDLFAQAEAAKPEIVVVLFGTNDSKPWNWHEEAFTLELEQLVRSLYGWESVEKICLPAPPAVFPGADGTVPAGIQKEVREGAVRRITKKTAGRLGTAFADLYEVTADHPEYFTDGVHPNAAGNERIAEAVLGALFT